MVERIFQLIPRLRNQAKKSVRVLPQQGEEPPQNATKIGGLFLWSEDEPWIFCDVPEIALSRDYNWNYDRSESISGRHHPSNILEVNHPRHNDAFVTVLQLRAEEFPVMKFPESKNIFQLLWCPRDHYLIDQPLYKTLWKNEKFVENPLEEMPEPSFEDYFLSPEPSAVLLQEVTEYPHYWTLSKEEKDLFNDEERDFYWKNFNPHTGIKVGGHPAWIQDPKIPICDCYKKMEHLLTVGSDIFEDYPKRKNTGLSIGDGGAIYIFICYDCEDLPTKSVFQCS